MYSISMLPFFLFLFSRFSFLPYNLWSVCENYDNLFLLFVFCFIHALLSLAEGVEEHCGRALASVRFFRGLLCVVFSLIFSRLF